MKLYFTVHRYGCRPNVSKAVKGYSEIAHATNMSLTELSMRYVLSEGLVSSTVIGVSNPSQLQEIMEATSRGALPCDTLEAIDSIHEQFPNPCP